MLSKRCLQSLHLLHFLAMRREEGYVPTRVVSGWYGGSHASLAKRVQDLEHAGLVRSQRGPNGGIALSRAPEAIRLSEVIAAIDGLEILTACVLGGPACDQTQPCVLHSSWQSVQHLIRDVFDRTTLRDLFGGDAPFCSATPFAFPEAHPHTPRKEATGLVHPQAI